MSDIVRRGADFATAEDAVQARQSFAEPDLSLCVFVLDSSLVGDELADFLEDVRWYRSFAPEIPSSKATPTCAAESVVQQRSAPKNPRRNAEA
jgi:hypothetical protein